MFLGNDYQTIFCTVLTYPFLFSVLSSLAGKDATIPSKSVTVFATQGTENGTTKEITYTDSKVIGNGSFGVVFQARLRENDQIVAIKRVLQDKRFKNRELNIMRKLDHCNIVKLLYYFFNEGERVSAFCDGELHRSIR